MFLYPGLIFTRYDLLSESLSVIISILVLQTIYNNVNPIQ